jgi:catechol 2,3-dioxygenase-like lactoylglutathione lyase family enzyme
MNTDTTHAVHSNAQPAPRPAWRFDHVNVVTNAHPQALAFFRDVMGWASGDRPPFPFPGDWLYQQGDAFVHAVHADQPAAAPALRLHHVAFRSDENGADVLQRVRASGLLHTVTAVPGDATLQIFVTLPGGLVIELDTPLDPEVELDHRYRPGDVNFAAV